MAAGQLTLALGVLPPPPARLRALRHNGGEITVAFVGSVDEWLVLRLSAEDAADTGVFTIPLDAGGGGFAIRCTVHERTQLSQIECEVTAHVDEVVRWKKRGRIEIDIPATVTLLEADAPAERADPLHVRLSDISSRDVGFAAAIPLRRGDRVRVRAVVDDLPLVLDARVTSVGQPAFGRRRVGCVFGPLSAEAARAIDALASRPDARAA
jgi:hypothetical protein